MLKRLIQKNYAHEEEQYLALIRDLLEEGSIENGRNGDTFCAIGSSMYFSLENKCIFFVFLFLTFSEIVSQVRSMWTGKTTK